MGRYISLTGAQKDELRRLTQLANRRIKAAERAYSKAGKTVLPKDVVGDYQIKEKWHTDNTPISRSVKFTDRKDYVKKLHELRRFEYGRPGIKEYTEVQRDKTSMALAKALGTTPSDEILQKLGKMSAPEVAEFWKKFSENASRASFKYSSSAVMNQTMYELFPEDMVSILDKSA